MAIAWGRLIAAQLYQVKKLGPLVLTGSSIALGLCALIAATSALSFAWMVLKGMEQPKLFAYQSRPRPIAEGLLTPHLAASCGTRRSSGL